MPELDLDAPLLTRADVERDWFGAPVGPTFRVARFVQALRRLRR